MAGGGMHPPHPLPGSAPERGPIVPKELSNNGFKRTCSRAVYQTHAHWRLELPLRNATEVFSLESKLEIDYT